MPSYRVFTGAPSFAELKRPPQTKYNWSSTTFSTTRRDHEDFRHDPSWLVPEATLISATQRISQMYKNVIFDDDDEAEINEDLWTEEGEEEMRNPVWNESKSRMVGDDSKDSSLISWPPTNPDQNRSRMSTTRSMMLSRTHTEIETQGDNSVSVSYAHTSTSSIGAFPTFVINLHTLSTLGALLSIKASSSFSRKVNMLVAVLEVDGPDSVIIKKGKDAGKEVAVLRLVVGDETGAVCKIAAWRDVAERWSGQEVGDVDESAMSNDSQVVAVKRGDIVYLTNISASTTPVITDKDTIKSPNLTFSASPFLNSNMNICYRTLPSIPADKHLRPDLRLAASDPGLRRVSNVVRWFIDAVGLSSD